MIILILVLGLILRFININQSLWLDEGISVLAASNLKFWEIITKFAPGDFHPPLYYLFLSVWIKIFGNSEVAVRMPSVIFALLTIYLTYKLAKEFINKKVGLIASFLLALAPLHVYYSQEIRMYSLEVLEVTGCFYFFLKIIKKDLLVYNLFYIIFLVAIFYTDYLAYLIVPAQLLYLFFVNKDKLKKVSLLVLFAFLLTVPWLIFLPEQLAKGAQVVYSLSTWAKVVGGTSIKDLSLIFVKVIVGRISFDNKLTYSAVVLVALVVYGFLLLRLPKKDSLVKLLLLWIIVPIALAFLISFILPVLAYHRLLFILPPFYVLVAYSISRINLAKQIIFGFILISISFISLLIYYQNPRYQREDWKNAAEFVKKIDSTSALVLFEDNHIPPPFVYYYPNSKAQGALAKIPANNFEDITNFENLNPKSIYLFEYLVEINDPKKLVEGKLLSLNYIKEKIYNFNGVGFVTLYSKVN